MAWQVITKLRKGLTHHHAPVLSTILRKPNGNLTTTDKEYVKTFRNYYAETFSRLDITFDRTVLDRIPDSEIYSYIDHPPTLDELLETLRRLPNHKAAGENGLTTDALKSLAKLCNHDNLDSPEVRPIRIILQLLQTIWNGGDVPPEWQSGRLAPIFKKGDPLAPGNWRPVCLLDITYKVMSAIIAKRMNPLIRRDGLDEACGCLENKGCMDAVFNLKSALQTRKEHGHETWVVFVDLMKAFDTVNHELMLMILKKYGFPPAW